MISKRRKESGGFIGYEAISRQIVQGVKHKRAGFYIEGPPAREGSLILSKDDKIVGNVTTGLPSPSLKKNIGQGYIDVPYNKAGTHLKVIVRNR
jgi:aminomethyltransferase